MYPQRIQHCLIGLVLILVGIIIGEGYYLIGHQEVLVKPEPVKMIPATTIAMSSASEDSAVIYVEHRAGVWSATIRYNGAFYEVQIGAVLPDGAKVVAIDKTQVLVQHGAKLLKL